jgi:CheY-like chemotaxis protein
MSDEKDTADDGEAGFRILIVDDNKDGADSLALLLKMWGYEVRTVYNPADALQEAQTFRPECIVSDIGMPGMSGYHLAEQLRRDEAFRRTPLIALTAFSDVLRMKAAGFDHYLVKPANPEIVKALLRDLRAMAKRLQRAEEVVQQQGEVVTQVRDLMKNVKDDVHEIKEGLKADVKELKQGLREVQDDIKEIKEELRDGKENKDKA